MPISIPNFLNNTQSPLGAAFGNLSRALAARPSELEQQKAGDDAVLSHWKMLGMQGLGDQLAHGFQPGAAPTVGTGGPSVSPVVASTPAMAASPIAAMLKNLAPTAGNAPAGPAAAPAPQGDSPIADAMSRLQPTIQAEPAAAPAAQPSGIDYGQYTRNALFAGVKPEEAGGYTLLGNANTYGARDPRTVNSAVGAGKPYSSTAEDFDINQSNDLRKAADTNSTSMSNNAATQATSRANNHDNIQKDYSLQAQRLAHEDAQDAGGGKELDPTTLHYVAEQIRQGVPISQLIPGMGKASAAMRMAAVHEAAQEDIAAGRTGTDAAIARQDYQGNMAGSRLLANREANIGTAVHALQNVIPTVKEQIGEVARTGLYPVDTILNAVQHGTNDPHLAKLAVSINDAVNLHAKAMNQGVITDTGRAQSIALLSQVHDAKFLGAALDQMMVGAERELAAPGQTRNDLHNSQRGVLGGHPAPAGGEEHWTRGPDGKLQRSH